jgi:hypothetical protein
MTQAIEIKEIKPLSEAEREEFEFHQRETQLGITKGQEARNQVFSHVLAVLEKNLWRENYQSEEEYVKTELNIEMSYFWRSVKNNRNYLHLLATTEDEDEKITLVRMRDAAYRELRRFAVKNEPLLKKGGEADEDYKARLENQQAEDSQLVEDLWKELYPRIAKFKKESNTGVYPTGGYSITAKDIEETCEVLKTIYEIPKLLSQGLSPTDIPVSTIEGEQISLQEVIDDSGEQTISAIEALAELGVKERLTEKMHRQYDNIAASLEKKYIFDRYVGKLVYKGGSLIIENEYGDHDLARELSDLFGQDTVISVRREKV